MTGSYVLVLVIGQGIRVRVGRLGLMRFEAGRYGYVGSAMRHLEKRVARHLRRDKKKHWHIDYLTCRRGVYVERVYVKEAEVKEECLIAGWLGAQGEVVAGFGASDCGCTGHLFRLSGEVRWDDAGMRLWDPKEKR